MQQRISSPPTIKPTKYYCKRAFITADYMYHPPYSNAVRHALKQILAFDTERSAISRRYTVPSWVPARSSQPSACTVSDTTPPSSFVSSSCRHTMSAPTIWKRGVGGESVACVMTSSAKMGTVVWIPLNVRLQRNIASLDRNLWLARRWYTVRTTQKEA